MKDQVDALVNRGIKAANLDSTLTAQQSNFVKDEVLSGSMKILYVAPERCVNECMYVNLQLTKQPRLNNEGFINMMSRITISLLAVDEAHCISQVGVV
jgi:superfamily II DNA helicase RecQ